MTPLWVYVLTLIITCTFTDAYRFTRLKDLLPSFRDPDYPADDYIDENDNYNTAGVVETITFPFSIFGYGLTTVKIVDSGIIIDASKSYQPRNGNVFALTDYPHIAPNWMEATAGLKYHMAYRMVDDTMTYRIHDLDRINKEVNQFLERYHETWMSTAALIVTWKISNSAGELNKFQAVLTTGMNKDTNVVENYILFLYGSNKVASAQGYVSAFVNGKYQGAATKTAKLCSFSHSAITEYSNYRCGTPGIYVLRMAAGTECSITTANQCAESYDNPNCMTPWVQPWDTCRETFYCTLSEDETTATMNFHFIQYPFSGLSALDFTKFIGVGTLEQPTGLQDFITDCQTDLINAGCEDADDTFSFNVTVNPVAAEPVCGVHVNTTEHNIYFALTVYDPTRPEVDLDGKFIIYGKCNYKEVANSVSTIVELNDYPIVEVVHRNRSYLMAWIDRPHPSNGLVLHKVRPGRHLYVKLCFNPRTPFVLGGDPFGVKVKNCYISNNILFNDYPTSGNTGDMTVQVMENGCVSQPRNKSFHFTKPFAVHSQFDTKGGEWCLVSGKMDAASLNSADKKIYLQCLTAQCTETTDTTCHLNCATSGGRSKRRAETRTEGADTESLVIELDIDSNTQNSDTGTVAMGGDDEDECISMTLGIIVIAILLTITMTACGIAIAIFVRIQQKNQMVTLRAQCYWTTNVS